MSISRVYADAISKQPADFMGYNGLDIEWGDPEKYQVVKKLGQGKYSEVFLGVDVSGGTKETERFIVLKMLKPVHIKRIKKEIKIFRNLEGGPNILRLLDVVRQADTKAPCFVLEYCNAIDFKTYFPTMPDQEVRWYLFELLKALDYAHSMGVMHRDVKPHNVVYDPLTSKLRLIDWGLADFYQPGMEYSLRVASRYFKSPELFLGLHDYDYSMDLWAVGVMLAQMIFIKYPFFKGRHTDKNQLTKIVRVLGTTELNKFMDKYDLDMEQSCCPEGFPAIKGKKWEEMVTDENRHLCSPPALDLLGKLLVYDHQLRLTAKEAMAHPYFDPVRTGTEVIARAVTNPVGAGAGAGAGSKGKDEDDDGPDDD